MPSKKQLNILLACIAPMALLSSGCATATGSAGYRNNRLTYHVDFEHRPGSVVCMGDSLTTGFMSVGAPYPQRLAGITGRKVHEYGVNGARSGHGLTQLQSIIALRPAYVCILYGTNDCITHTDFDLRRSKENLRHIVRTLRANGITPVIATIPVVNKHRGMFNGNVAQLSQAIREIAREEKIGFVDLHRAFGDGSKHLNPADGLHFSNSGGNLVAKLFAELIQ